MRILKTILFVLLFSAVAAAQGKTHLVRSTTSLPATCNPGNGVTPTDEVDLVSGGTTKHYICSATNTWTQIGGAQTWNQVGAGSNLNAQTMGTGGSMAPANVGQVISSQYILSPGIIAPTTSSNANAGSIPANHSIVTAVTYNTAAGSNLPSIQVTGGTLGSCGTGCNYVITAPTLTSGYTSYSVYACDLNGGGPCTMPQLIVACTNITGNCTITNSPTANTTSLPTLNTAWTQPPNVQAQSSTIPVPQGWVPSLFATKVDSNNYPVLGLDPSTCSPLVSPCGVPMWVDRLFLNDTGVNIANAGATSANIGNIKNNLFSVAHMVCNGTTCTNGFDDRAIGIRTTTPTTMTGSSNARIMGVYGELQLNGTPTALSGAGPDVGALGIRWTVNDNRSGGTLSASPLVALDGAVFILGTGGEGSCDPCFMGVRGAASGNASGSAAGVVGGASGGKFTYSFYAAHPSTRATNNVAYFADSSWGSNTADFFLRSDSVGLQSLLTGPLFINTINSSGSSLALGASLAVTGSVATSQLSAPTGSNSCGVAGATSYVGKFVAIDSNGNATTATQLNFNNCASDVNAGQVMGFNNLSAVGATRFDVYLTSAGGTCNGVACVLGKVGSCTPVNSAGIAANKCTFFYTGTAGDGTSPPTINNTGGIQSAAFVQSAAKTFASLPACTSSLEGSMQAVTDSATATWGATITGSSTNHVLAYCDGTNWTVTAK